MAYRTLAEASEQEIRLMLSEVDRGAHALPKRLLAMLRALDVQVPAFPVTRFEHSLQSASRAQRDGRDEEYVVAALLHDIGDELAPYSHGEICSAIFHPYVSERICWIIEKHPIFQLFYYAHLVGEDRNARYQFRNHPWYRDAVEFCAKYDQNCFDAGYESLPLEVFVPMVDRVFASPRYLAAS